MKQLEMRMITLQWKDKHERKQEQRDSHGEVVRARRWWKGTAQTRNQKRENANTNKMERKSKEWKGLKETDWQTNRQTVRHTTSSASFLPSRNKSKWSCLHFSFHVDICFVSFFLSFQNKEKGHIEEEREIKWEEVKNRCPSSLLFFAQWIKQNFCSMDPFATETLSHLRTSADRISIIE